MIVQIIKIELKEYDFEEKNETCNKLDKNHSHFILVNSSDPNRYKDFKNQIHIGLLPEMLLDTPRLKHVVFFS
jgi:hypothetical protein